MCSDHYVTTGQGICHVHVHPSPASIVHDIVLLCAGTTGERIVLVGDSSGGNFAFGVSMKLKELGLRMPDSILSIYPNVNTSSSATPSRITALWDPILPLGVMLACQAVSYNTCTVYACTCTVYVICMHTQDILLPTSANHRGWQREFRNIPPQVFACMEASCMGKAHADIMIRSMTQQSYLAFIYMYYMYM